MPKGGKGAHPPPPLHACTPCSLPFTLSFSLQAYWVVTGRNRLEIRPQGFSLLPLLCVGLWGKARMGLLLRRTLLSTAQILLQA